jgi:hypothetical protein
LGDIPLSPTGDFDFLTVLPDDFHRRNLHSQEFPAPEKSSAIIEPLGSVANLTSPGQLLPSTLSRSTDSSVHASRSKNPPNCLTTDHALR